MIEYDMYKLGLDCQTWRINNGIKAVDIARELGCSKGLICRFEYGTANNAKLLLWYLSHGYIPDIKSIERIKENG